MAVAVGEFGMEDMWRADWGLLTHLFIEE